MEEMTLRKEIENILEMKCIPSNKAHRICRLVKERLEKQIQCILCDMQESMAKEYHEKKLYELITELSGEDNVH